MNKLSYRICGLLLLSCLCGCASQKYKYNVVTKEIFDIKLSNQQVAELPFRKRSEPYITCLKEQFANTFKDPVLNWKCLIFREALASGLSENDSGYHVMMDTLNKVTDDTLKVILKEMMKPFIVKEGFETREPSLSDIVKEHVEQTVFPGIGEAIVDFGKQQRFYLRRDKGFWRIYKFENLEYPED